jgi:hypothetical protein
MAWLRIDDRVRTHPKIVQAGPAAAWLWFCGVCYCREHLTDGFIQTGMVPTLAPGLTAVKKHVAALVAAKLWDERPGGYDVHDFLDWNPSRAEVEAMREADKRRKRVGFQPESGGPPNGFQDTPSRTHAGDAGSGSGLGSAQDGVSEERNQESVSLAPRRRFGGSALMGSSYASHANHAFCHERGVCLPRGEYSDKLLLKFNGDAVAMAAWLTKTADAIPPDAKVGNVFRFFDQQLDAEFGATAVGVESTRTAALRKASDW